MTTVSDISSTAAATWRDYVGLLRPSQWVKNVVVFAGPAAGLRLTSWDGLLNASLAFIAFCLAASGTYAVNDAFDRKADALHPTKRHRPVARGAISPAFAVVIGVVLAAASVAMSIWALTYQVTVAIVLYLFMTLAYSVYLKQRMILDVIIIATGFVLRAWAGSLAVGVPTSHWLIACMFTLCLFLGFGKRRCEIAMLANSDDLAGHRKTLLRYTPDLLNHLITVSAGIAIITFLLYTLDKGSAPGPDFPKEHLFYTLPIVVYGIFRYAMQTELGDHAGPTEIVLNDKALIMTIILWAVIALTVAYQKELLGPAGIAGWLQSLMPQ
jgi:4-hydroxybenzoate polyprenyltransferase